MTLRHNLILLLLLCIMGGLLAACSEENPDPAPGDEAPVLIGFEALPKQLATIALTPTPTPVAAGGAEAVAVAAPTQPSGPLLPTPTLTPYVGIFLGEPTSESGEVAPTLAPWVIGSGGSVISSGGVAVNPVGGVAGNCGIPVADAFANAYAAVQAQVGCPVSAGITTQLVTQPFERGNMYWRDTRQIYALASSGQFWQMADSWQEGMAADDPNLSPPEGAQQPVRGFGLVWRSNAQIQEALGWGLLPEIPYNASWQDFESGSLFVGANSQVFALITAEGRYVGPL